MCSKLALYFYFSVSVNDYGMTCKQIVYPLPCHGNSCDSDLDRDNSHCKSVACVTALTVVP